MRSLASCIISAVLVIASSKAEICRSDTGDKLNGGACYTTTHTLTHPIDSNDTTWKDVGEIKEYHFHPYWFQHRPESKRAALRLRSELIAAVAAGKFIAVFPGITDKIIPGIDVSKIPVINNGPMGPHPCGSFETWVPKEHFTAVLSFFMQRRGELTILIHPLTRYVNEDHGARNMWLGPPMRIDPTVLPEDIGKPPFQYPELKLGYSAAKLEDDIQPSVVY